MKTLWYILIGLFISGFVSGSLLPGNSEVALLAALFSEPNNYLGLILAVTLGNVLGGVFTYYLGFYNRKLFPKLFQKLAEKSPKYESYVAKYGLWIALLTWAPVIGDPLLFVMGTFKTKPWPTFALMTMGKTVRYGVLAYLFFYT